MQTTTTVLDMPEALGKLDQVVDYYRHQIRTGRLSPGDPLPSNRKLASEWRLSTATILRAMAKLQAEHWIEPRSGKTPIVSACPQDRPGHMTWTRLDDTWGDDPVFDSLDHQARWHYLMMIQVCSRGDRQDGVMRLAKARQCSDVEDPMSCIAQLVTAGLVENVDGETMRVVRIKAHLPSAELLAKQAQDRARAARYRKHKAGDHTECSPDRCDTSRDASRGSSRDARDWTGQAGTGTDLSPADIDRTDEYLEAWGESA